MRGKRNGTELCSAAHARFGLRLRDRVSRSLPGFRLWFCSRVCSITRVKRPLLFGLLFVVAALIPEIGRAQTPVRFVDPQLEAAIRHQLQIPTGELTDTNLQNLVWLQAYNCGITNLSGLEFASRLETLDLGYNAISDITPLCNLSSLTYLWLNSNQIRDGALLTNLTSLQFLALDYNPISSISPLQSLPALRYLSLGYLPKLDLATLTCFTNLQELWVPGNVIRDPAPLVVLTNLRWLGLDSNPLNHPENIASFTNLTSLSLGYTCLSNLNCVAGLTGLTELRVGGIGVRDLEPVSFLTNLTLLDLTESDFEDYSVLGSLPRLQMLYLDRSQSVNISSLRSLRSLTWLSAAGLGLTDLDFVTNLTQLRDLFVPYNRIQNLEPVSALTNLEGLMADFNRITAVEPLSNFAGRYVSLTGNLLDVSPTSPTMEIINGLTNRGIGVSFEPQHQPPTIELLQTNWTVAMNQPSCRSIYVFGQNPGQDVTSLFASVSDPSLITTVDVLQEPSSSPLDYSPAWHVRVFPALNQTGSATLTLFAWDDLGFFTITNIEISVREPLPFPGEVLNCTNLVWFTAPDQPWFAQEDPSADGFGSAQSGTPDSWLMTTLTGPGTLTFWTKKNPEGSAWLAAECLESGATLIQDIGWQDWHKETVIVPPGTWTFWWYPRFFGSWYIRSSTMWVDTVSYTPGSFSCSLELVAANRPNFSPPVYAWPDGSAWLALHGELGVTYLLESSPDLQNWSQLATIKLDKFTGHFGDVYADLPARFYRARRLP